MSNGYESTAKTLLKARPTAAQLDDRLAEPWPAGLEFYLDRQDIISTDWLSRLTNEVRQRAVPAGFVYVVEGPLRSIDGTFFDLSQDSENNRETLRRTIAFGAAVGATAAVIHVIAPSTDPNAFSDELRLATLRDSRPLLWFYRDLCHSHNIIPTVENIPPVAKMREGRTMHSVIGMEPADLLYLIEQVPGVKVTVDVSHAQLYLNAARASDEPVPPAWRHLVEFIRHRVQVHDLDQFLTALDGQLLEAHISNASGLTGEGMPYDEGDLVMDQVITRLSRMVRFLVTETIESDADRAIHMRAAQHQIDALLRGEVR